MNEVCYRSIFKDDIIAFIALKRALGFKYVSEPAMLRRIDGYFADSGLEVREISRELCEGWCRKRSHESPANHSSRISMMRVFCRYLNDIGVQAYIPPPNLVTKAQKYDAHIYTADELKRFFQLSTTVNPFHPNALIAAR